MFTSIDKEKFEKYSSHEYSFFEVKKKVLLRRKHIGLGILAFAGLIFVTGLSLSFLGSFYPITFPFIALFVAMFSVPFLIKHQSAMPSFRLILDLLFQEDREKLLEIFHQPNLPRYRTKDLYRFAVAALVDLKSKEIGPILYQKWEKWKYFSKKSQKPYLVPLEVLCAKLGHNSIDVFKVEDSDSNNEEAKISIPITKVYFLTKLPVKSKCMISGLSLDPIVEDTVVCPYCGNMAKENLLSNWLKENNTCPVCRVNLKINDCPLVLIKKK